MEYRKATLSDIDALCRLREDMLREEEDYPEAFLVMLLKNTREYIQNSLADGSLCAWVAEKEDGIIAMGSAAYFTLPPNDWCPNGKTAYIGSVYTLPSFRKQGIATQLLSLIIGEAKERKCQRILLNASDMGRPMYERLGFVDFPSAMALYPFGIRTESTGPGASANPCTD